MIEFWQDITPAQSILFVGTLIAVAVVARYRGGKVERFYEVRIVATNANRLVFGPVKAPGLSAAHAVEELLNTPWLIDYGTEGTAEVVLEGGVIMRFPFCKP